MSLKKKIAEAIPRRANDGCQTCAWLETLPKADRQAFDEWILDGRSLLQLHAICIREETNPLKISTTGFRHHMVHHRPL